MSNSQLHDHLLISLYEIEAPAPVGVRNVDHFELDRERRILEVCSSLHKYWPITTGVGLAHFGDEYYFGIASQLQHAVGTHKTFEGALSRAQAIFIQNHPQPFVEGLKLYEDAVMGEYQFASEPPSFLQKMLADQLPLTFYIIELKFNPFNLVPVLKYYLGAKSPQRFIREMTSEPIHKEFLAVYDRAGNHKAVSVTHIYKAHQNG